MLLLPLPLKQNSPVQPPVCPASLKRCRCATSARRVSCSWLMQATEVVCLVLAMTSGVCPACMQGPAGPETQAAALAQPPTVQQGPGGSLPGARQPSPRATGAKAPAAAAVGSPPSLRDRFCTQQAAQQQPQPNGGARQQLAHAEPGPSMQQPPSQQDSMAVSHALEPAVATVGRGPGAAAATSEALPHTGSEAGDSADGQQAAGEGHETADPQKDDSAGGPADWEAQPQVPSAAELQQPEGEVSGDLDGVLAVDCAGSDQGPGLPAAGGSEQGEAAPARGSSRSGPSLAFAAKTVASLGKQEGVGQTVTAAKPVTGGPPTATHSLFHELSCCALRLAAGLLSGNLLLCMVKRWTSCMEDHAGASADWLTDELKPQKVAAACASQARTHSLGLPGCSPTHERGPASAGAERGVHTTSLGHAEPDTTHIMRAHSCQCRCQEGRAHLETGDSGALQPPTYRRHQAASLWGQGR